MRNIAIFVSGEGNSTERIVRLFNEGNRLRTVLVIADDSSVAVLERLKDPEITKIHIPDNQWTERLNEVELLLRKDEVCLIVSDSFALPIPEEIIEAGGGKIINVSDPLEAPREVVAALEADLRKPAIEASDAEEVKEESETAAPKTLTADQEWAEALKINFTPPKVPVAPPPVPGGPAPEINAETNYFAQNNRQEIKTPGQTTGATPSEPMPSTYLVWAVLATVLCCFIPGIVAIIFSAQVSSRYYAGDLEGAKKASRRAQAWIIVSVVLGIIGATLYIPFMLFS